MLHTFTYCNALDQGLRRAPSVDAARGVFHGAMKLYLDRFLNMPAARLPRGRDGQEFSPAAGELLQELDRLLDREQQINQAGALTFRYLSLGHDPAALISAFGHLLLREDAEFYSYQMFEAGVCQFRALLAARPAAASAVLVAVTRYLAAHSRRPALCCRRRAPPGVCSTAKSCMSASTGKRRRKFPATEAAGSPSEARPRGPVEPARALHEYPALGPSSQRLQ